MNLFSEIIDKVQPILTEKDLGFSSDIFEIKIYSPTVLSQGADLEILSIQDEISNFQQQINNLNDELNNEAEVKKNIFNKEELKTRKDKMQEGLKLRVEIINKVERQIELSAKLPEGEGTKRIDGIYKKMEKAIKEKDIDTDLKAQYEAFISYPRLDFVISLFTAIQEKSAEINNKKLGITDEATVEEKN